MEPVFKLSSPLQGEALPASPAMEPPAVRVVLFEAERLARETLGAALEGAKGNRFHVVGTFGEVRLAQEAMDELHPDLVVVEPRLPTKAGGGGGPELISQLFRMGVSHGSRLLTCSATENEGFVVGCLRAGVHGYVAKSSGLDVLLRAMTLVAGGENFYDAVALRLLAAVAAQSHHRASSPHQAGGGPRVLTLTTREREVWRLIASGRSTKQVAAELDLELKTVVGYRTSLMAKLGLHNPAALTLSAVRCGLVSPW